MDLTQTIEPMLEKSDQVFDRVLSALMLDRPLVYTKINHNFWERLVFMDRSGVSYFEKDQVRALEIDQLQGLVGRPPHAFVETGFVEEVLALVGRAPTTNPDFIFSASLQALPFSDTIQGIPFEDFQLCENKIARYVPSTPFGGDGLEFKRAIANGRFAEFAAALREKKFLLVANQDLEFFSRFIGADAVDYLQIDGSKARYERETILARIKEMLPQRPAARRIVIQAGGSLSTWLAVKLFEWDNKITFLDLGNALCICNPSAMFGRVFGKLFCGQIMATIDQVHPGWFDAYKDLPSLYASNRQDLDRELCQFGRSGRMIEFANSYKISIPNRRWNPEVPIRHPVDFIENKPADIVRVNELMAPSIQSNHFANSGPVSRLLEASVHGLLNLPSDRKVVVCSSCTSGLQIAAGVAAVKQGRRMRWIGSAFGFLSSNIGHFSEIQLIDCAQTGSLEPAALSALPPASWDGLLFTNAFALGTVGWAEIRDHCQKQGKYLIVDNAVGLLDRPRTPAMASEIEVISCHHTKPWGYGEGGIMIVPEEDEDLVRSLINFGAGSEFEALPYSANAKISDLSCASILERLERMDHWSTFYKSQESRIRNAIRKGAPGLTELEGSQRRQSPSGNLQFLCEHPVPAACLPNEHLILRKYYRPVCDSPNGSGEIFQNAQTLYDYIINIPCHPFVRNLDDRQICDALGVVMSKASGQTD